MLAQLRRRSRLSRRELADLAGLSESGVGFIERGYGPRSRKPLRPQVETLRKLAAALATDGDGLVDESRRDEDFRVLMLAAGYLPEQPEPQAPPLPRPSPPPLDLRAALRDRVGDRDIALYLFELSTADLEAMDDDDRQFVRSLLEAARDRARRARRD